MSALFKTLGKTPWPELLAEAEADYERFGRDLAQAEALLSESPQDAELLHRRNAIRIFVDSLAEGVEIMKIIIDSHKNS